MIFYILLGIAAIVAVAVFINFATDPWGGVVDGAVAGFVSGAVAASIGFLALLLIGLTAPGHVETTGTETYQLRAVNTTTGVKGAVAGSFFVTTGYINSTRVISYIEQDGPAVHVGSADASASELFEDGGKTVTVTHWHTVYPWWYVPWDQTANPRDTYAFHIPAGSVQGDYQVSAK